MLHTPYFKNNEVYTIKLVSGEEILAKVVDADDKEVILISSPKSLLIQHGQNGPTLVTAPFMISLDDSVTKSIPLCRHNIVSYFETPKKMADEYLGSVSGIQIATESQVTTNK